MFGEMLSMAQATRRDGGIVIVQVKRLAKRGTLPPKSVKIPGILVDYVVVDPGAAADLCHRLQPELCRRAARAARRSQAAAVRSERKIVARRAAMETRRRARSATSAPGISTGISAVAAEEGILDDMILTNEQGFIGGAPLTGVDSGAAQNYARAGRSALPVRLLRRRRPRPRVPVLRRGRSRRATSTSAGSATRSSASAASSTSARTPRKWCSAAPSRPAGSRSALRERPDCASCRKAGTASSSAEVEQICYNATLCREQGRSRAVRHRARACSARPTAGSS